MANAALQARTSDKAATDLRRCLFMAEDVPGSGND
jgi:hypothetical protein